jgi:hypothetical protein
MITGELHSRKKLTLGADPEIFAFKGNKLLPAYMFLPPKGNGRLQYWDGFQAEFKFLFGYRCQNNLVKNTRESLRTLDNTLKAKYPDAHLSLINVVKIPQETLTKADPQYVMLGCEPSFNAYKMFGKPVENPRKLTVRFAGGHMHFGGWYTHPSYAKIVKTLDKILGVWAVGAARFTDTSIRRQYYGMAGEYRTPHYSADETYGVEYRTLSNFWLASPGVMQATWDLGRMCVKLGMSRRSGLWVSSEDEVVDTINNCDTDQAARIINRNKEMFDWLLGHVWTYNPKDIKNMHVMFEKGIHEFVPNPNAIPTNWHFKADWKPNGRQPWARWSTCNV